MSIARLLCGSFEILLLDEHVSGVNPDMTNVILEKIKEIKGLGKTIIAVEHNIEAIEIISDYICFMDSGKIIPYGLPKKY